MKQEIPKKTGFAIIEAVYYDVIPLSVNSPGIEPGIELSDFTSNQVSEGVRRVIGEYGEVLRKLSDE